MWRRHIFGFYCFWTVFWPYCCFLTVFGHVLGLKVDPIRNVTASHFGFWAIGLIYSGSPSAFFPLRCNTPGEKDSRIWVPWDLATVLDFLCLMSTRYSIQIDLISQTTSLQHSRKDEGLGFCSALQHIWGYVHGHSRHTAQISHWLKCQPETNSCTDTTRLSQTEPSWLQTWWTKSLLQVYELLQIAHIFSWNDDKTQSISIPHMECMHVYMHVYIHLIGMYIHVGRRLCLVTDLEFLPKILPYAQEGTKKCKQTPEDVLRIMASLGLGWCASKMHTWHMNMLATSDASKH